VRRHASATPARDWFTDDAWRRYLDADLAAALEVLAASLGPLQVLDVHPTPPGRRPAPPPAPGPQPAQPGLFDPQPTPGALAPSSALPHRHGGVAPKCGLTCPET
jgi:hypothetical protein